MTSRVQAVRDATRRLAAAGIADAGRDARLLVAAAAGLDARHLILDPDRALSAEEARRLESMLQRRTGREPVSRILGVREFYGRPFIVTPDVLDPRPDSETLIAAVLEVVDGEGGRQRPLRIIDVGTGSGCLLLTLLAELPRATGVGTDIGPATLEVARRNGLALGVADRASFRLQQSLPPGCGIFDILVANPPYIPTSEIAGLDPDVRDFDPRAALDGGADGLAVYREISRGLLSAIPNGWAFFEIGPGQARDVARIVSGATGGMPQHQPQPRVWHDLDGRERCVAVALHS